MRVSLAIVTVLLLGTGAPPTLQRPPAARLEALVGGPLVASIHVRDRINSGALSGATLYVSGPFIQHEPYPNTEAYRRGVKGPEDARAKVKKITDAGVDVVKLIDQDQMTLEEMRAV